MLKSTDLHSTDHAHAMAFGTTKNASASTVSVSVKLTILGPVPSMKNGRRLLLNKRTGKMFNAKSAAALAYEFSVFPSQVPLNARVNIGSKEKPLRAIVSVWYSSYRSDLDCAIVYDLLQTYGVVSNDRWIREKHEYAHVDPKRPRVEIVVEEI